MRAGTSRQSGIVLEKVLPRIFAQADLMASLFVSQHVNAVIAHRNDWVAGAGFEPAAFRL